MRAVFCKEELDLANGISSFSKGQLATCKDLATVFCYDEGESVNDLLERNIVFIMEQLILWRNILIHVLWQDLN